MSKEYNLNVQITDEGRFKIQSTNDGFTALELIGIIEFKRDDIIKQIKGEIEPDSVKRNFIEQ